MKQASDKLARDYRKAYIKLLSGAVSVPKAVDEYFFGPVEERTEEDAEVRPYFYGSMLFAIAVALFISVEVIV